MGALLHTFTFERVTYRKTAEKTADSIAEHIAKVKHDDELDKTASNVVGALASSTGIFARDGEGFVLTKLGDAFLKLYASNKADSGRWILARSLWRFVVPNGTGSGANTQAQTAGIEFAFFHSILQLLTHLSAAPGEKRFLYFEELCKLLEDDNNWRLRGDDLFALLTSARSAGGGGFGSHRSFLEDLENKSKDERSEFDIPRDNFSGLFIKAFAQTGFFQFQQGPVGKPVAVALSPDLDVVLQRRVRFILDHPPTWDGDDWPAYIGLQDEDLPQEVTTEKVEEAIEAVIESEELKDLIPAAKERADAAKLSVTTEQLLRFASCLESKRFLILTGLAGSGKTKLAQAFARWITPVRRARDIFSPGSIIPSERTIYYVNKSDSVAVEFWNAQDESQATKVTLPREIITEWANYIKTNRISEATSAREIREAVKATSKFSDQLHSFETHLKATAFALLKSKTDTVPDRCYEMVPVGADWTGNENVLGYPNGLNSMGYVAKPALELILQAAEHADCPHFLILDEMNLSHVERYFADILSIIESDEGLELYAGDMEKPDTWRKTATRRVPPRLKQLPENFFVIGTVNVDETTYMFSPKVLDRANVIEFRMDAGELGGFLDNTAKPDLSSLDGKGASFGKAFVDAARTPAGVPPKLKAIYDAEMLLLFKTLQGHGAEFGYRTAFETARFIHFYKLLGNHSDGDASWFPRAFDCVVFQKLLPKLHGSRAKLGPVLKKLWFLCVNDVAGRGGDALKAAEDAARSTDKKAEPSVVVPAGAPYPLSAEKIGRMWRLLIENGFASFAEA